MRHESIITHTYCIWTTTDQYVIYSQHCTTFSGLLKTAIEQYFSADNCSMLSTILFGIVEPELAYDQV